MDYKYPKAFITQFLFKGLLSSFNGFAFRKYKKIAKNEINIDLDDLFSELISGKVRLNININSYVNKMNFKSKNNKTSNCDHYKRKNYLKQKFWIKHPELNNNKRNNNKQSKSDPDSKNDSNNHISNKQLMTVNYNIDLADQVPEFKSKFMIDSKTTKHYCPNQKWFIN